VLYVVAEMPCFTNPCLNGGTCLPYGTDNYTCECTVHWSGRHCESGTVFNNNSNNNNTGKKYNKNKK